MAHAAGEAWCRRPDRPARRSAMRTYTATTTAPVRPEALLDVLTDPEAIAVWAPVPFSVDDQSHPRLAEGSRVRVSGRLAGQEIGFDVQVHQADAAGLMLSASGPVALDVAYELREAAAGSEVSASIAVLPRRGLRARLLAEATAAVLAGGMLQHALGRLVAEGAAAWARRRRQRQRPTAPEARPAAASAAPRRRRAHRRHPAPIGRIPGPART